MDRRKQRNEYIKYFKMVKEVDWVIVFSLMLQLPKIEGKNLESFKKLEEKFSYEDLLL
jgi:hypothetical protein